MRFLPPHKCGCYGTSVVGSSRLPVFKDGFDAGLKARSTRTPHYSPRTINAVSDIYILGIESSCDETAAAVVRSGEQIVSNVVYSQIATHQVYGGVVP